MKTKALETIKNIQNGKWDRNKPEPPKGEIASMLWNDPKFAIGMEYGAIVVLMQLFNLKNTDLK